MKVNFTPQKGKNLESLLKQFDSNGLRLGFSSGTTGKLTFLPRDAFTQQMIARSYEASADATVKLNKGQDFFILGIPGETFLQVGFNGRITAQRISPKNIFYGFKDLKADIIRLRMRGPRSSTEQIMNIAIKKLLPRKQHQAVVQMVNQIHERKNQRLIFLAPPFLLVDAAKYVIAHNLDCKLTKNSFLASTGGFKGKQVTSRDEMDRLLKEAFDVDKSQYLDLYGMTESNSIFVECTEGNKKHIPPWLEVILFDENMEPIKSHSGQVTGRYAFLEPSSKSFPGFIMTGDVITIDYTPCPHCNKKTPTVVRIERGVNMEGRGCSGVLSKSAS